MSKSNRHKAEVIEVYENGLKAAVKFYCSVKRGERIECVNHNGTAGNPSEMQAPFHIGQKGMVDFTRSLNGYHWVFMPNEEQVKMIKRLRLGDYLGSLTYAGQCDACGVQFMSNWDWVYFREGSANRYCSEKCCKRKG